MEETKGAGTQRAILQYITAYIQQHGYSPSVREIGAGVGLRSSSSVQAHLRRMLETGELETDAGIGIPRAIRVSGMRFVKEARSGKD